MPIKSSRYFNDPNMASAASNLAALFEPPSGSDEAGYALARERDLQSGQRKALWDYIQGPDVDRHALDLGAVVSDLYDPSQSFYAVDETQKTELEKNAADNVRALQTNKSDNLAKLIIEGYGNVGEGEVQPAIPLESVQQFGGTVPVPEVQGREKPLSLEQQKAKERQGLLESGLLTEQNLADIAMGEHDLVDVLINGKPVKVTRGEAARRGLTPVLSKEEVVGTELQGTDLTPDQLNKLIFGTETETVLKNGAETVVPRYEIGAEGAAAKPGDVQGLDTYMAVDADGKERSFVGFVGPDNKIHNQETNEVITGIVRKGAPGNQMAIDFNPDGTIKSISQGGKAPTDAMMRSGFAAKMAEASTQRLLAAYDDPAQMPTATDMNIWPTLNQMARSESITTATLGRFMNDQAMSPAGREFFLNLTNILPYELMQKSGAATTQTDWATSLASAVPQPNDTPAMRQIRKERLETFIKATYGMATGTPVVDPNAPAAPGATPAPSTTPAPAATAPADNDRAETIANAKDAIAAGKPRAAIEAKIKAAFPDFKSTELD